MNVSPLEQELAHYVQPYLTIEMPYAELRTRTLEQGFEFRP